MISVPLKHLPLDRLDRPPRLLPCFLFSVPAVPWTACRGTEINSGSLRLHSIIISDTKDTFWSVKNLRLGRWRPLGSCRRCRRTRRHSRPARRPSRILRVRRWPRPPLSRTCDNELSAPLCAACRSASPERSHLSCRENKASLRARRVWVMSQTSWNKSSTEVNIWTYYSGPGRFDTENTSTFFLTSRSVPIWFSLPYA